MSATITNKIEKIKELEAEMKRLCLWQKIPPQWVNHFEEEIRLNVNGFALWLQYVFIPNHTQNGAFEDTTFDKQPIVPTAIKVFGNDIRKGRLLQILIEMDGVI